MLRRGVKETYERFRVSESLRKMSQNLYCTDSRWEETRKTEEMLCWMPEFCMNRRRSLGKVYWELAKGWKKMKNKKKKINKRGKIWERETRLKISVFIDDEWCVDGSGESWMVKLLIGGKGCKWKKPKGHNRGRNGVAGIMGYGSARHDARVKIMTTHLVHRYTNGSLAYSRTPSGGQDFPFLFILKSVGYIAFIKALGGPPRSESFHTAKSLTTSSNADTNFSFVWNNCFMVLW